jgi:hypothetical protein
MGDNNSTLFYTVSSIQFFILLCLRFKEYNVILLTLVLKVLLSHQALSLVL